mmetsp:Transcript_927/g.3684  ORF Transcript_927/g.3684 Transcript_927/m.3684 type:complete len:243 (-) Transcript_927:8-736(-)
MSLLEGVGLDLGSHGLDFLDRHALRALPGRDARLGVDREAVGRGDVAHALLFAVRGAPRRPRRPGGARALRALVVGDVLVLPVVAETRHRRGHDVLLGVLAHSVQVHHDLGAVLGRVHLGVARLDRRQRIRRDVAYVADARVAQPVAARARDAQAHLVAEIQQVRPGWRIGDDVGAGGTVDEAHAHHVRRRRRQPVDDGDGRERGGREDVETAHRVGACRGLRRGGVGDGGDGRFDARAEKW